MLEARDLMVHFGSTVALDGVDLDVAEGETVALLGPSGCGKSTLLRVIAGLQEPMSGTVSMDGRDLAGVPPHRRSMGLMFQDNQLFGHRDVAGNVGFGPRVLGWHRSALAGAVDDALALVGLPGFGPRDVATLSGGEAQRVALARALAPRPRLLMLDEPLGSLDRALRDRLVEELPDLLDEVGVSSLHVTHDHDEAFAVSDRVAVMTEGRIRQVGSPGEVWRQPGSEAVARFLGHDNIVEVEGRGEVPWGRLPVDAGPWLIRVDAITPADDGDGSAVEARVVSRRYRGDRHELGLRTEPGGEELTAMWPHEVAIGDRIRLSIDVDRLARLE